MPTPKTPSKTDRLTRMLRRASGATTPQLCKALGWRPHSVRAAISGLRKTGLRIERETAAAAGGGARYRIVADDVATKAVD